MGEKNKTKHGHVAITVVTVFATVAAAMLFTAKKVREYEHGNGRYGATPWHGHHDPMDDARGRDLPLG